MAKDAGAHGGRWGGRAPALLLAAGLLMGSACSSDPPMEVTSQSDERRIVEGVVVGMINEPPFSYLKVDVGTGLVWLGVPSGAARVSGTVRAKNCVAVRNYRIQSIGGRLPLVYFGTIDDG
ncbi:MAG TPA: hypothetical protein VFP50_02425 [Anaeromyxobacteraceae bacterium]|nr:hypothetical protein [Anaeromyxobacteraceae bacterium]